MIVRNVKKSLVGIEDLLLGKGPVIQTRGTVNRLDVPIALDTTVEMSALDIAVYTRARVYSDDVTFVDYIYDANSLAGIISDTGPGTWVKPNGVATGTFTTADAKIVTVVNGLIVSIV